MEAEELAHILEGICPDQEVGPCTADESQCIITRLHVFPEMDVAVIEDICGPVQVVEALRRKPHADIPSPIKKRDCSQKEILPWNLYSKAMTSMLRKMQESS